MARVFTMVNAISFLWLKGWHAPAGRRIREPRPLPRPGGSDRAAPVGARNLGPGRQIVSQDSPSGVSRFGGHAGPQAPTRRAHHAKTAEAGAEPEGLPTSPLPNRTGLGGLQAGPGTAQIGLFGTVR